VTRRADRRRGVALLEVLVALAVLGTSAAALVALGVEAGHGVERARAADTEMRHASAFMDVVALWPRADLDRRMGERRQGPWVLRVDRENDALFVVSLRDSAGGRELLRTRLFRPDSAEALRAARR
jgi:prepilin-type N-terminal cleavage/methylation domain-containing protein